MVKIDKDACIGCGKCIYDCIAWNLRLSDGKASPKKDCFLCGHCVAVCPANAVSIPEYDMADVEDYDKEAFSLAPEAVLHSIKFRRSIRDYKNMPIEQEKLAQLLQAGRYTATAKNNQDCHFIFVQKELEALKKTIWGYIDEITSLQSSQIPKDLLPFAAFNRRRKADPSNDYLFRNAPAVLYITSDWPLDAGLAAQNIELMAVSLGLGCLYNGYLSRITDASGKAKEWLGIEGKTIKACMLLGYPNVSYKRTAPRRGANVIWK